MLSVQHEGEVEVGSLPNCLLRLETAQAIVVAGSERLGNTLSEEKFHTVVPEIAPRLAGRGPRGIG